MKDLRTALRTRLLANASLSTEVGGSRIYPIRLPDDVTYPALTYQKVSDLTTGNLDDVSRIKTVRMQIDIWADTALKAWEIADYVRTQLDGFDGTVDGVAFEDCILESESDIYEDAIERYRVTTDYMIVYF